MNLNNLARPSYLLQKLSYKVYELRHPNEPWVSQDAVRFCNEHLDANKHVGLEWGSGRSTTWYAKHLRHLTSVEHFKDWYDRVKHKIEQQGVRNVDYRFVPLDHAEAEANVPHYDPLPKYVSIAQDFANDSLDFVVVDGHYRQACILAALPKLRSGGLLLVDNTNWLPLTEWGVPTEWEMAHQSSNVMTQTTIWRKP